MIKNDVLTPIYWNHCSPSEQLNLLKRPIYKKTKTDIYRNVKNILNQVYLNGDNALIKFNLLFDQHKTTYLKIPLKIINNAKDNLSNEIKTSINMAFNNITKFHQAQYFSSIDLEIIPGVRCQQIIRPINTVGLYVPGGLSALPSTVMMLGIPAKIAQCKRVILCSPPPISNIILYTAQLCNIQEIYQIGGSQAIAAMGFGTESIPKVNKIFGPGNIWVTEAKRQILYETNTVDIDMLAGPSEILIIADETANPIFIAADLLSQAEHGPDSHVILITTDINIANKTRQELFKQIQKLSRVNVINQSLIHGRIIITNNMQECFTISNNYAPEHLVLQIHNATNYLRYITNAGSIFLGNWSPESAGDYASGTNHVLPTYGHAATISGLGVTDFQKRIFVQELNQKGLLTLSQTIITLAKIERLQAHEYSIIHRLNYIKEIT